MISKSIARVVCWMRRLAVPGVAVAMMAAGWDGCPETNAPGFPQNIDWSVRFEGLNPLP
jgi:hypothetical protein